MKTMNEGFSKRFRHSGAWAVFLASACLFLVAGCEVTTEELGGGLGAAAEQSPGLAPRSLAGHQMEYSDNHGSYTYTFFDDGRYRFASISQNRTMADSSEGRWEYRILSPGNALLTLNGQQRLTLRFNALLQATGTWEGDVRPYSMRFYREDGE